MPYQGYQGGGARAFRKLYGYKNLIAWQAADDLAALVHEFVRIPPSSDEFPRVPKSPPESPPLPHTEVDHD